MVYNLDSERVNCDRLFNIFCAYGNITRVSSHCFSSSFLTLHACTVKLHTHGSKAISTILRIRYGWAVDWH